MEEVVVLRCTAVPEARRALRALHRLHDAGAVRLDAVSVVGRGADGRPFAVEQAADERVGAPGSGVVGVLTGPFGVVLENAPDALVGSLVDIADADRSRRLLRCFGDALPPGSVATIALVSELSPVAIDWLLGQVGGVVVRRSREDVEHSIGRPSAGFGGTPGPDPATGRRPSLRRIRKWFSARA
jgi:uncharacterized membrane protein